MTLQSSGDTAVQSVEAVNQILQTAQQMELEHARKMVKATVTTAVKSASLPGTGEILDLMA